MSGKIILITGGARSGKSTFAERLASQIGHTIGYVATAEILDAEMQQRVELHQRRRPNHWLTIEAPFDAHKAIEKLAHSCDAILFDCITMYISNLLLAKHNSQFDNNNFISIMFEIDKLIEVSNSIQATVIFVTNEVGASIVPDNALARQYRDIAGAVNQKIASVAIDVYFVVCGVPVNLKQLSVNS